MPYDGLFSFLRQSPLEGVREAARVNALWRAFFISTAQKGSSKRHIPCVNALWRAFFISTTVCNILIPAYYFVSMPYDGLFSFLPGRNMQGWSLTTGVNALWRAFFISTYKQTWNCSYKKWVSMPYDGLFSFLHYYHDHFCSLQHSVSMPYDGLFSFLLRWLWLTMVKLQVSMPYDGLFSFLRSGRRCQGPRREGRCQCPMTGFFHFYEENKMFSIFNKKCQCPMTGFFHFYSRDSQNGFPVQMCVNALWRAFFISTR